ncbi:hypothetical protein L2E82_08587 [Cichorium intybus]|uniref:Uncharacterized protein n=1 Tax=Cichorium intybus TaxID=13427 RepID=A0ACB9G7S8_CICIN|nr:hypothetical protein L2E82_08587 [Cichorium intybus]
MKEIAKEKQLPPVSENLKNKVSAATEEVWIGKQEFTESSSSSANESSGTKSDKQSADKEENKQEFGHADSAETIFSKVISGVSSSFQKAKDAKVFDLAKKGYGFVKDELSGSPSKRKRAKAASSQANVERSTRKDIVVMQGHLLFKRMSGFSEPVVTKSQEIVVDMQERWETSDHHVVHNLQE